MKSPQTLSIIGLGYVGLPLAIEFAKKYKVIGFDINPERIHELNQRLDRTEEASSEALQKTSIHFTSNQNELKDSTIYIITVPTPLNSHQEPDLSFLLQATELVGSVLKLGDLVIYESTVYPGCTEEICAPLLAKKSGLIFNQEFFCGYSPERINPGDKTRTLSKIKKITSGSTPESAKLIDELYASIIEAGTFKTSSIKVAEAAKVIENTQRDLNIALMNELSLIFKGMNLETSEVLEAAGTKWNFYPFKPGLVGGHCIGVDPLYLAYKAKELGLEANLILTGRKINDSIGHFVARQTVKLMTKKGIELKAAPVLVLGLTFKENFSDIRNSKVIDLIQELKSFHCHVDCYDPKARAEEVQREYGLTLASSEVLGNLSSYAAIIIAVAHDEFKSLNLATLSLKERVIYDVKGIYPPHLSDERL